MARGDNGARYKVTKRRGKDGVEERRGPIQGPFAQEGGSIWIIVAPYELHELYDSGILWNFTNFTLCWTICRHCIAGLAAPNTSPH